MWAAQDQDDLRFLENFYISSEMMMMNIHGLRYWTTYFIEY